MDETQEVWMVLEKGSRETMLVLPLGDHCYRLASTPLLPLDVEVYWGDIIEAYKHEDGFLHFQRIVERAPLRHSQHVLSKKVIESAEFARLLKAIESCGGESEILMGGIFRSHIPEECSLDIDTQLQSILRDIYREEAR